MSEDLRQASCHCGTVRFTVQLAGPLRGARCDCSICSMKGAVMLGVPLDALEIAQGREHLTCYQFNTGVAKHWFCSRCGIHCFHQRRSDPTQYGVNAACLEGVSPYYDFPQVPVSDGVHHAKDSGQARLAGTLRFEPNLS